MNRWAVYTDVTTSPPIYAHNVQPGLIDSRQSSKLNRIEIEHTPNTVHARNWIIYIYIWICFCVYHACHSEQLMMMTTAAAITSETYSKSNELSHHIRIRTHINIRIVQFLVIDHTFNTHFGVNYFDFLFYIHMWRIERAQDGSIHFVCWSQRILWYAMSSSSVFRGHRRLFTFFTLWKK